MTTIFNDLFVDENDYWQNSNITYEIAFLISDQHLTGTGGIGQYAKAFYDMCLEYQIRLHLILDKTPTKDFRNMFKHAVFHYVNEPIPYTIHNKQYGHTDTMNVYKTANFHSALVKAEEYIKKEKRIFDLYICNTSESILAAYSAGASPLVIYTHLYKHIHKESDNGKFTPYFHNIIDSLSNLPDVYIGTQTTLNEKTLRKHHKQVVVLPIPMPEQKFLERYDRTNTKGVLFVGRYEDGKRPEKFLKICKQANVPVKILTSEKSAIKFKNKCIELNLEHDIRYNLQGIDKLDFMLSSSILLNISKNESFSITTMECIGHMPVLTLDDQPWTDFFDNKFLLKYNKKEIVQAVKQYHDRPYTFEVLPKSWYELGSLQYIKKLDYDAKYRFISFLKDLQQG